MFKYIHKNTVWYIAWLRTIARTWLEKLKKADMKTPFNENTLWECLHQDTIWTESQCKLILMSANQRLLRIIPLRCLKENDYGEIVSQLNVKGFKTKRGASFEKGSLCEILQNEKHTAYIYGKNISARGTLAVVAL